VPKRIGPCLEEGVEPGHQRGDGVLRDFVLEDMDECLPGFGRGVVDEAKQFGARVATAVHGVRQFSACVGVDQGSLFEASCVLGEGRLSGGYRRSLARGELFDAIFDTQTR